MVYIESSQPVVQRVNTASMLSKLTLTICLLFSSTAWAEDTEYDCTQRMDYSVSCRFNFDNYINIDNLNFLFVDLFR